MAQNKMTIRKGDTVKVIAGKDRGKTGKVLRSVPEKSRVVVEKVNMVKKAMRPTQANPQGGAADAGQQAGGAAGNGGAQGGDGQDYYDADYQVVDDDKK